MRILFVAFSDSVHVLRWLRQLDGLGWDLHLFPSNSSEIHPDHDDITIHNVPLLSPRPRSESVRLHNRWFGPRRIGMGLCEKWCPDWFGAATRLARLIRRLKPDIVHSLELQHAGYLTLAAKQRLGEDFPPWIVTNYGSDIVHFRQFPEHRERLRSLLEACDYYDCECRRDVAAARELGFRGTVLRVSPNAGGFDLDRSRQLWMNGPSSARRWILLKGYQNWSGRALMGLEAISRCADVLRDFRIGVYSAGPEVRNAVENLARLTGLQIEVLPPCSHEEMLARHGKARVGIGISACDGISTSLLEALLMGSLPVQTCTACADEWIEQGVNGLIVPPDDVNAIAAAIRRAATDDELVNRAAEINARTAAERLDDGRLRELAVAMYRQVLAGTANSTELARGNS